MSANTSHPRSLTPQDYANPHPIYVVWELTLKCDQACRHCGSRAGTPRSEELGTEDALRLVRQLAAVGVREVALIGGESYLRKDWTEIMRAIVRVGMSCILVTGGRQLTPERVRAAKRAGVSSISISIDGLQRTHDSLRSVPGSWSSAMAALDVVRRAGVNPSVNTQINRKNRFELEELGDALVERGARAWQLQWTNPMGRAADHVNLTLQPYHLLDIMPRLARLSKELKKRGCQLVASDNIGYFGPHEGDLRMGGHWIGCTAGKFSLGVQSDGRIKACASLPTVPYASDNIRDRDLADILADSEQLKLTAQRDGSDLWGYCKECYYARICQAGCVWNAHTYFGRPGNTPFCHHRALEFKAQGLRERLVRVEDAPGEAMDCGRWELVLEPWQD